MRSLRWLLEVEYFLEYILVWPLATLARVVNEKRARQLAKGLGRMAYRVLGRDRRWALRNLELIFADDLNRAQRTNLAIRSFENIVQTRLEGIRWNKQWMLENVSEEGAAAARAAVAQARERGLGAIVITGHLGSYELIPPWVYHHGFGGVVMYRPQNNWRVERLLMGSRVEYLGQSLVARRDFALLSMLHSLREGRGAGMLIDINTIREPVWVNFLGFAAASPAGAAALALASGAPVILAVAIREPRGRHRIIFHPPFPLIQTGRRRRDIAANSQQYHDALAQYILAYPGQYNWPHPRWRFRPDGSYWTASMPIQEMQRQRLGPLPVLRPDGLADQSLPPARGGRHAALGS